MDTFTDRLEALLKAKSMSKTELSELVGCRRQTISDWKKNGSFPTSDIAVKIAKILNTSVEYLITGEESHTESQELQELKTKYEALAMTIKGIASTL